MSKAYKCDRCGKYQEINIIPKSIHSIRLMGVYSGIFSELFDFSRELCDECFLDLEKFLKEKK